MLELKQINYHYKKRNNIFEDLSYTFNDFGFYLLKGKNGEGKTTLFNLIYGLLEFQEGKIYLDNEDIEKLPIKEKDQKIKEKISYLSKDFSMFSSLSLEDNLRMVNDDSKRIEEILKILNLEGVKKTKIKKLSLGEKQRAQLAILYMLNKDIWLLDEPFAHLDDDNKKIVLELLKRESQNHLIIAISHDDVEEYVDVILQLTNKKIIEQGRNIQEKEEVTKYKVTNKIKYRYIFKGYWSYFLLKLLLIFVCSVPFTLFFPYSDSIAPNNVFYDSHSYEVQFLISEENTKTAKPTHPNSSFVTNECFFVDCSLHSITIPIVQSYSYFYSSDDYEIVYGQRREQNNEVDIGLPKETLKNTSDYVNLIGKEIGRRDKNYYTITGLFESPCNLIVINYDYEYAFINYLYDNYCLYDSFGEMLNINFLDDENDEIIISNDMKNEDIYFNKKYNGKLKNRLINFDNYKVSYSEFDYNKIREVSMSKKQFYKIILDNDFSSIVYANEYLLNLDYNSETDMKDNYYEYFSINESADLTTYHFFALNISLIVLVLLVILENRILRSFRKNYYNYIFLGVKKSHLVDLDSIFNYICLALSILLNVLSLVKINLGIHLKFVWLFMCTFQVLIFYLLEFYYMKKFYKKVGDKND